MENNNRTDINDRSISDHKINAHDANSANNGSKPDYKVLERGIYLKITLIVVAALLIVVLLRQFASSNNTGDLIVYFLQRFFDMSYDSAIYFYRRSIRSNLDYIMYASVAFFFVILSRFLLSQFAKYFNEISGGLDMLVEDRGGEIRLSPEMETMERKLKTIKQTLLKREEEARSAEQRKNDLVMYLAHDIKTPLTTVIGYLSLLEESPQMPPEQKAKYVNITLEKAYRLEKLVDEFFEITRYSFQKIGLAKEHIDLYYMLAQMTDEFYPLLEASGKKALLDVPQNMTICGDPDKLARVFNNVLKNAIAYSPEHSAIEIAAVNAHDEDDKVLITFKNAGTISQDKLDSIFEKFYRLDSARSTDTGGAGLGLAIAKEIVLSHGGRIYAASDHAQTTFTIELPIK